MVNLTTLKKAVIILVALSFSMLQFMHGIIGLFPGSLALYLPVKMTHPKSLYQSQVHEIERLAFSHLHESSAHDSGSFSPPPLLRPDPPRLYPSHILLFGADGPSLHPLFTLTSLPPTSRAPTTPRAHNLTNNSNSSVRGPPRWRTGESETPCT